MEPLTGKQAAQAIQTLMGLGNAGARFDRRRVTSAIRTHAGRLSVLRGVRLVLRQKPPARRGESRQHSPRRVLRAAAGTDAPGRPQPDPETAGGR